MRPQKVTEPHLIAGLMSVIRAKGYDGATLNDLASASGLKKASLYHRFPNGKKEIAQTVLNHVCENIEKEVKSVLKDQAVSPTVRIEKVINSIKDIYQDGKETCILRALALDSSMEYFSESIQTGMQYWVDGFAAFGEELGDNPGEAQQKALYTFTLIQGSLVISKIMNDTSSFQNALSEIKGMYTTKM